MRPQKIAVVGPVASGKSTLAAAIAHHTGLPHIDLDRLFWGPCWTPVPDDVFHDRVQQAVAQEQWITDGNYGGSVGGTVTSRAELTIWLDLPLRTCLPRLLNRSVRRAWHRHELFAGNRETWSHLIARDSILWWGPVHHHRHRRRWNSDLAASGRPVLRLHHAADLVPALHHLDLLPARWEARCPAK
ncbi:hypothetical protein LN042_30195 [Kitasatospora sp. RB6PN24]|uniref:hypothetical protein n=1 Tax=Kitasatospora humi TaxID=2893891 RepID=UPI001E45E5D7|nr:hypothetical protein [Kitasatospora humi]MCC9311282.1 hypothetical protein [Kitasatospora humi]